MTTPPQYHRESRAIARTLNISEPMLWLATGMFLMMLGTVVLAGVPVLLL
jgi:hypothetical protein